MAPGNERIYFENFKSLESFDFKCSFLTTQLKLPKSLKKLCFQYCSFRTDRLFDYDGNNIEDLTINNVSIYDENLNWIEKFLSNPSTKLNYLTIIVFIRTYQRTEETLKKYSSKIQKLNVILRENIFTAEILGPDLSEYIEQAVIMEQETESLMREKEELVKLAQNKKDSRSEKKFIKKV
jgi:hypothetical protein